ncbi:MAG: class I adenylate-forming enzyme family protein, partial [Actinomycetota bacterium]|nr:class I adenylate-forming enzyme family protein [Actinomycetota bacterium]
MPSAAARRDDREATLRLRQPGGLYEIGVEDVRGRPMAVFRNRLRSLGQLLEASARFGERTYLVDGDTRITFTEHLQRVRSLAGTFRRDHGVGPGDRVAIFAANRWEWVVAFWAAVAAGAVPAGFNGWWTADEFTHATRLVEPVLVLADGPRLARVRDASYGGRVSDLGEVVAVSGRPVADTEPVVEAQEDEAALLLFTSGTTGRPKAATIPHRAVIGFVQLNQFSELTGRVALGAPVPLRAEDVAPADDVQLVTSPLFHTSMLYGAVVTGLFKGSCSVLLPGRFDPERVLAAIERERVTQWSALGSAATRLAACGALDRYDRSSMRYLGVGGAPVSPTVQQRLRDAFPGTSATVGMGYTSTEAGAVVARTGGPELAAHPTSTGRVMVTVEVELRDPEGRPVEDGCDGEVHVLSPYVMLGYWNDQAATSAALDDGGWLAMGDVARFEDGRLYINARARDLIFVNAENVAPTEVEYVLEAHPGVVEAAVLASDDEVTGDAVWAVVVADGETALGTADLTAW